jgi:hypothetical protein
MNDSKDTNPMADKISPHEKSTQKNHFFSLLGRGVLFTTIGLGYLFLAWKTSDHWAEQAFAQKTEGIQKAHLEKIRKGGTDCLVQPDAAMVDAIFSDAAIAKNIKTLYLGNDVSGLYLARLKELPNLKCIVLLNAKQPEIFLERISGMKSVETISLERSYIPQNKIDLFSTFPNLDSLCFPIFRIPLKALEGLKNHPALEKLYLTKCDAAGDDFSVLKSLPRLRELTIRTRPDYEGESVLTASLRQALPDCKCIVRLEER